VEGSHDSVKTEKGRQDCSSPGVFYILPGRKRAGIKVLGSADWILGTWEGLPKSRVHAAWFEIKGQPFYGWFGDRKPSSPFLTGFSSGFSHEANDPMNRIGVEFGP